MDKKFTLPVLFLFYCLKFFIFTDLVQAAVDLTRLEKDRLVLLEKLAHLEKTYFSISEATESLTLHHDAFLKIKDSVHSLNQKIKDDSENLEMVQTNISRLSKVATEGDSENEAASKINTQIKAKIETTLESYIINIENLTAALEKLSRQLQSTPNMINQLAGSLTQILGGYPKCTGWFRSRIPALAPTGKTEPKTEEWNSNERLIQAAVRGDFQQIKALLENQNDSKDPKKTPVSIDYQDADGTTALMHSCLGMHTNVVSYLLEKGARLDLVNNRNETALQAVHEKDQSELTDLIYGHLSKLDSIQSIYEESQVPLFSPATPEEYEISQVKRDIRREEAWITGLRDSGEPVKLSVLMGKGGNVTDQTMRVLKTLSHSPSLHGVSSRMVVRYLSNAVAQVTLAGFTRSDQRGNSYSLLDTRWVHVDLKQHKVTKYFIFRGIFDSEPVPVPVMGKAEIDMSSMKSSLFSNLKLLPLGGSQKSNQGMVEFFKENKAVPAIDHWSEQNIKSKD